MTLLQFRKKKPTVVVKALPLRTAHIKNCKVVSGRADMLEYMPKHSICAEIGIFHSVFSREILENTKPKELHLIDDSKNCIQEARQIFKDYIGKTVFLHYGNSFEELARFPNNYFDWLFIDASHSYDFVKKDLSVARLKTKDEGFIAAHDYILYDYIRQEPYGVVQAVNEFCNQYDYEILFVAFESNMFNTVVLRAINHPS